MYPSKEWLAWDDAQPPPRLEPLGGDDGPPPGLTTS
jgi:hypothetical protein